MIFMIAVYLYKIIVGIVLGIVQGISEWLPISSKTQILLASSFLLNFNFSQAYTLGLFLEGGTFIAALIYFRKEVVKVLLTLVGKGDAEGWLLLKYLIVVTLVTMVIAVPIYKVVSSVVTGPAIGVPMIVLGILLVIDGLLIKIARAKYTPKKEMKDLGIKDFIVVGIAQGLSALPGISRSGATVSTLLFLKTKPDDAFRLSFFALIPASLGATLVTVIFSGVQIGAILSTITLYGLIAAVVVSTVISLILITLLIKFAGTSHITWLVFTFGIIAIVGGSISLVTGVGG